MSKAGEMPASGCVRESDVQGRGVVLLRRVGILAGAGVVIFLLGFLPAWLTAGERAEERDAARRELRLARLENALGFAAVYARRGQYEPARQATSDFFTALRQEVDLGAESALTKQQRDGLAGLLARRDETITLLARADPASAERLSDLYAAYLEGAGAAHQRVQSVGPEKVSVLPRN